MGWLRRCTDVGTGTDTCYITWRMQAFQLFIRYGIMPDKRRFVLLDRDGTVNVERHYLSHPDQLVLLPGAAEAIRDLKRAGFGVALVTNQSGIARGYFDAPMLEVIHARLQQMLAAEGGILDGIFVCPHLPDDACSCRKPLPGLIHRAARSLSFAPEDSIVVGDKEIDIELGRAVGAETFLVRTGYGKQYEAETRADHVVDSLFEVAHRVLNVQQRA